MNAYEQEVKAIYEALAGRPLTDAEVADIALTLRQFAAFLVECGQDEDLRARLGMAPSAAPSVVNCTTQNDGAPLGEPLPARPDPLTGAPLRDSTYRESSAFPVVLTATTPDSPVEAVVPGRQS